MKLSLLRTWKDPKSGTRLLPGSVVTVAAELARKMIAREVAEALNKAKAETKEDSDEDSD